MKSNTNNWHLGEIVSPPRTTSLLKQSNKNVYNRLIDLQYICVREATENKCGILVRVLGKTKAERIMSVCGQPFCNDDKFQLFEGQAFSSYSFPTVGELMEVLNIIRSNPSLLSQFEAASMPFELNSLFWVNETTINFPFTKKPRCYDASTNSLCKAPKDSKPYRLTMVYFNTKQELVEPDIIESVIEKPILEKHAIEEPAVEKLIIKEPVIEKSAVEKPIIKEPVIEKSAVEKPAVGKPVKKKPEGKSGMRGVIIFICIAISMIGAFIAGKHFGDLNTNNLGNIEKGSVTKSAVEEIVSSEKNNAPSQQKETISQPKKKDTLLTTDQYEAMDIRVKTGAYRIIGTEKIVTVKPNEDLTRISNRTLGPGMECYIEVYNGIKSDTPLEPGREIKIPKVELKKKKPQTN